MGKQVAGRDNGPMKQNDTWFRLRLAAEGDVPELERLISQSVRVLQASDYSDEQREAALISVYGVDTQLIKDGTYYVAETRELTVGCGGWSRHKTLFGGDHWTAREDDLLDPKRDAAKIRAFFVRPGWERRGIGSAILEACEKAAADAGFIRLEMGATLTGVPLYRAHGYCALENIEVPIADGLTLPIVRMGKDLPHARG